MSRLAHLVDSRFTIGGEVVNLRRLPPFTPRKIRGTHFVRGRVEQFQWENVHNGYLLYTFWLVWSWNVWQCVKHRGVPTFCSIKSSVKWFFSPVYFAFMCHGLRIAAYVEIKSSEVRWSWWSSLFTTTANPLAARGQLIQGTASRSTGIWGCPNHAVVISVVYIGASSERVDSSFWIVWA
jgi:hypothetical protein